MKMEFQTYAVGDRILDGTDLWEILRASRTRWGSPAYRGVVLGGTRQRWITPRLVGRRAPVVDRSAIRTMVEAFYRRVGDDSTLGPIFDARIHGEWEPHLATMVKFWSAVLLREMEFEGNPPAAHRAIRELAPEHFARWLALLDETLAEVFEPAPAEEIRLRARAIARGLSNRVLGAPWDANA